MLESLWQEEACLLTPSVLYVMMELNLLLMPCGIVTWSGLYLGVCNTNTTFFTQDIRNWLKSNATTKPTRTHRGMQWNILFPFAIWLIWEQRNWVVFKNKGVNPSLANVISMQATEFLHCVNCPRNSRRVVVKQVKWERPGEGWLKLNTDGAANDLLNSGGVAL